MKPGELRRWKTEQYENFEGLILVIQKVRDDPKCNDIWQILEFLEKDLLWNQFDGDNLLKMSELIQEAQCTKEP